MESYYDPADFAKFSADGFGSYNPELWEKAMAFYGAAHADDALASFHLKRLLNGAKGVRMQLE